MNDFSTAANDHLLPTGDHTPLPIAGVMDQAERPLCPDAEQRESPEQRVLTQLDELVEMIKCESEQGGEAAWEPPFELPADFLLSVIIPVYNECETVAQVVRRVESLPVPKEIILVDDGSVDGTRDVLATLTRHRVILKDRNEGKGAALRDGFRAAQGTVLVIQDADLEYHPADILKLLPPLLEEQADVVYGSRFLGEEVHDPVWWHRAGNAALTALSNWTTGLRLTDMETCYKAFRREALEGVEISQNRFGFEPEITARLARKGWRFCEVPVHYNARSYDQGKKIGWRDGINAIYCILRYGLLAK